ncbi:alpha/beta fold hydrolase [Streptomyces macrolidinus]|uniref:alpha/beta fold hydrolase n=1 Tax=Streptomyces macrolidinus TaxID=2952607 RepID=UPI0027E34ECA|nr:hypothetical protein [Streptomyces macrolidinus]
MIRGQFDRICARPVDVPDDVVADLRRTTYPALRKVLRRSAAYLTERNLPARLAALDVPVLVIFGAAEPRYAPSSVHQYDAVPNARIEVPPGVGLLPMFEAPDVTSELLLDFAARVADTPPIAP